MITTNALTIIQIMCDVKTGRIRIPDFQRSSVWGPDEVAKLLDSIYRSYPLGSFLMWETTDSLRERDPLNLRLLERRDAKLYLIDGQQRTIALYGVFTNTLMLGEDAGKTRFRAYYNIDDESFNVYDKDEIEAEDITIPENQIPLDEAIQFNLDTRATRISPELQFRIVKQQNMDRITNLNKLFNAFSTYVVGEIIVAGVGLGEACEIFVRMNMYGVRLDIVDIMVARTYYSNPLFNLREKLDEFNSNSAPNGYQLNERTILECSSACIEHGVSQKDILESANRNKLRTKWRTCIRALNKSMDFLQARMVKVSNFLPNDIVLAPLTYFFYEAPHPTAAHHTELEKWFWNVSISQRYLQGQNSKIAEDIRLMNKIKDGEHVPTCEFNVPNESVMKQDIRLNSALSKSILCLLSTQNPKDWITNQRINMVTSFASANEKQFHHIFPKKYLSARKGELDFATRIKPFINSISNIAVLTALSNEIVGSKPPSEYLPEIRHRNSELEATLTTHMISDEAYARLIEDDFGGFLAIRSRDIATKLNLLLQPT